MTRRSVLVTGVNSLLTAMARGQVEQNTRTLVAEGQIYVLGATEQVSGPGTHSLTDALRGRYLLSVTHKRDKRLPYPAPLPEIPPMWPPPPTQKSLNLWDAKLRRAKTLRRYTETEEARIEGPTLFDYWLTPTIALGLCQEFRMNGQSTSRGKTTVLLVNCERGTAQDISFSDRYPPGLPSLHPTQPLALFFGDSDRGDDPSVAVYLIGPAGLEKSTLLATPVEQRGWSADGQYFYFTRHSGPERKEHCFALDSNLQEIPLSGTAAEYQPRWHTTARLRLPIRCVERVATLTVDSSQEKVTSLWLAAGKKLLVRVAAEIDPGSSVILCDGSAVAYLFQSALYVVPITKLRPAEISGPLVLD